MSHESASPAGPAAASVREGAPSPWATPGSSGRGDPAAALALHPTPGAARACTDRIRAAFVAEFPELADGTLEALRFEHPTRLLELYDAACFGGLLGRRMSEGANLPVVFRWSTRLTRSVGQTKRTVLPDETGAGRPPFVAYEIAFSSLLLFESFRGEERKVSVSGLICNDRLDAFLRTFEHELLHLHEFLDRGATDCQGPAFRYFASRLFGHTESTHNLVTRREHARVELGIQVGDTVRFDAPGGPFTGTVERITRRATVRVRFTLPRGQVIVRKYYVPLPLLSRAT